MWTGTATRVTVASGQVIEGLSTTLRDSAVPSAAVPSAGNPSVAANDAAVAGAAACVSGAAVTHAMKHSISRSPANSSVPNAIQARWFLSAADGLPLGTVTRSRVQRRSTSAQNSWSFSARSFRREQGTAAAWIVMSREPVAAFLPRTAAKMLYISGRVR